MAVLCKVKSGAQTGADVASLRAAKRLGIPTGGTMPKGWRTLDGPRPEYADLYGMVEHASSAWGPRTYANAHDSDATLRIAVDLNSAGERLTAAACAKFGKPIVDIKLVRLNGVLACDPARVAVAAAVIRSIQWRLGRPLTIKRGGQLPEDGAGYRG